MKYLCRYCHKIKDIAIFGYCIDCANKLAPPPPKEVK